MRGKQIRFDIERQESLYCYYSAICLHYVLKPWKAKDNEIRLYDIHKTKRKPIKYAYFRGKRK